jgi:hypothetical protein
MKKQIYLVFLLVMSLGFLFGCSQMHPIISSTSDVTSNTSNTTLPWIEYQGHYYTKNLEKAQRETPFPILLPSYLPNMEHKVYLPDIDGPLKQNQKGGIEINITYNLKLGSKPGILIIHESTNSSSLGDVDLNPDLEQIKIQGISVVKTRDDWSPDTDAYYSFNSNNIYYTVETHYLQNDESNKIVESMIKQLG